MTEPAQSGGRKGIATNRRAFHDYHVIDRIEAGIQLSGTEVKSIRAGHITLVGGYAYVEDGSAYLCHINIAPYECGNRFNHEPERRRLLLLHRKEIERLQAQVEQSGLTLVPLECYWKRGHVKIELGICKGKQFADKRETIKRKEADRETARAMRRHR
jgi:SsrA-binding protein